MLKATLARRSFLVLCVISLARFSLARKTRAVLISQTIFFLHTVESSFPVCVISLARFSLARVQEALASLS